MSERRTLIVAGLGRCGTSLVMRMLAIAGVPTVGSHPDYEDVELQHILESQPARWPPLVSGKAVKVLDAQRWTMPPLGDFDMIWLARNPEEQAKSMIKLISSMFVSVGNNRQSIRAMSRSIARDTPVALRNIRAAGRQQRGIALKFEDLVRRPLDSARVLCTAMGIDPARAELMAAQVVPRRPECLPYMLEFSETRS